MADNSHLATLIDGLPALPHASLLARLAFFLAQAARASYPQISAHGAIALRSYNEMVIVTADELLGLLRSAQATRSGSDFVSALEHWAEVGDCKKGLDWAVAKALSEPNSD